MDKGQRKELFSQALEVRKDIVRMISLARVGDIGASLAAADLFVFLYWRALQAPLSERNHKRLERFLLGDRRFLPALYAVLARRGFFTREDLWSYGRLGAVLQTLPGKTRVAGVETPALAPGLALGFALGVVEALRRKDVPGRVSCCVGEEELVERAFWESVRLASEEKVDLLLLVLCRGTEHGRKERQKARESLNWQGWRVGSVSGHNLDALEASFAALADKGPEVLFVDTVAGRGLSAFGVSRKSEAERQIDTRPSLDAALRELDGMRREWEP